MERNQNIARNRDIFKALHLDEAASALFSMPDTASQMLHTKPTVKAKIPINRPKPRCVIRSHGAVADKGDEEDANMVDSEDGAEDTVNVVGTALRPPSPSCRDASADALPPLESPTSTQPPPLASLGTSASPSHLNTLTGRASTPTVSSNFANPTATATHTTTGNAGPSPSNLGASATTRSSHPTANAGNTLVPSSAILATWLGNPLKKINEPSLGSRYLNLLRLLCKLEATHKFINKTRGFGKVKCERPAQLAFWVRDRRGRSAPPFVHDVPAFEKCFWAWWSCLQPEWRIVPLRQEGSGNWAALSAPGANGMLGVVACLCWWGKAVFGLKDDRKLVVGGNESQWLDAVADVTWVFEELIHHLEYTT